MREAGPQDMAALLEQGAKFHAASGLGIPLCLESLEATIEGLFASDTATILTDGEGSFIAAMTVPSWLNAAVMVGQELWWWAKPGAGLGLLDAVEDWARARGAQFFVMVALEELRPAAVGALYRRRSYRPLEHGWVKEL